MPRAMTIAEILKQIEHVAFHGDESVLLNNAISIAEAMEGGENSSALTWVGIQWIDRVTVAPKVGLVVIEGKGYEQLASYDCNFLVVNSARLTFLKILNLLFDDLPQPGIEPSAQVADSTTLGEGCYIGRNVVIEEDCVIGSNTSILHNTVILKGTRIGRNCRIGCNNTIGNYGFGYEKDDNKTGDWMLIPHIGNVIIGDRVEIHNNTCIDRAVMGSTRIEDNVKIDNQVHIAHGVHIHRNALIIANALVAGSVVVGEGSWIGPTSTIKNKIKIAPNTLTGIGAVVVKDTEPNSIVLGNPAISMDKHKAWSAVKKELLAQRDLEKGA